MADSKSLNEVLKSISLEEIEKVVAETEDNLAIYSTISEEVIKRYTKELDDVMQAVYTDIISVPDPSISVFEKYHLELSNCLYFMQERLEKLGSLDYLSKTKYKEVYNQAYLDNQLPDTNSNKKKTVNELVALSEEASKSEAITNDIYARAYKVLKNKIDAANTMISTISKSISRRMGEEYLPSTPVTGVRKILNETIDL